MSPEPELFQKSLKIERLIPVSKELLWHYLSTGSGLACWQADDVQGNLASGEFSLRWPVLGARIDLRVEKIERHERLCLRAGSTRIELEISDGALVLIHRGIEVEDDLPGLASSWHAAMGLLEVASVSHPRLPRRVEWLFESINGSPELLHHFLTDRDALGCWLGEAERTLCTGEDYALNLFGNEILSGRVLYSGRDVCLKVRELSDGVLTLRTLPGPSDARLVAVAVSTFTGPAPERLHLSLKGALGRLKQLCQKKHS